MASLTTVPIWRFLGEPSIIWSGRDLTPLLGRKALGLIAYLALAREGAGRDELARILWPPADSGKELARAKHSLRQCLVVLRKLFGADYDSVFEDAEDWLRLRCDAVGIDLRRLFQFDAEAAVPPNELADLCRGPFLRSVVTRARPFDDWAEQKRGHLTQLAGQMLEAAHADAERGGDRALTVRLGAAMAELGIGRGSLPSIEIRPVEFAVPSAPRRRWVPHAAAALAVLAVGLGGAYGLSGDFRGIVNKVIDRVAPVSGPPRISVLPFTTLDDTAEEKGLANGITLGIYYALYAISELYPVTPAPTTRQLDQAELVARAKQLGVRYIISGAVGSDGDDVRVDVQCFDAESRTIVWSERFRQKKEQIFKLQDDITLQILKGLKIELSTAELNRIQYLHDTDNLEAWLAAAKGVAHLIRVTRGDVALAKNYYEEALRHDPKYVSARRGLAWVAFLSVRLGWAADPRAAISEAKNQLGVVQQTKPDDGTSKSLEGAILLLEQKYDEAIKAGEAAVATLPGSADAWGVYAHTLTYVGEHKRALEYIRQAMALSEIHPAWYRWTLGRALRMDGQFGDSVEVLEQDLGRGEPSIVHLVELTASYAAAGRIEDARRLAAPIKEVAPGFTATAWLSHPPIKVPEVHSKEFEYLSIAGL